MRQPRPTRILREPFQKRFERKVVFVLVTDVGTMALKDAAARVGLTRSAMYHRLFCAKNTSWRDDNIFDDIIPKTKTEPVPVQESQPLPGKKIRRDPETLKTSKLERRLHIADKFRSEQIKKNRPCVDAAYAVALTHHRLGYR